MPDGRTSFQALQNAFGKRDANIVYFVFDLLALDGEDLTSMPLEERKQRLAKLVGKTDGVIRYSDHVDRATVRRSSRLACEKGLEGHRVASGATSRICRARHDVGEDQVPPAAGARDRRLHRSRGRAHRYRRAARRLLRGQASSLRGQGRHRVLDEDARSS